MIGCHNNKSRIICFSNIRAIIVIIIIRDIVVIIIIIIIIYIIIIECGRIITSNFIIKVIIKDFTV